MHRRVAHLAKRTREFLDFVTRAHANLAAQGRWMRHRSSSLVRALFRSGLDTNTNTDTTPNTNTDSAKSMDLGDPGRVARAVFTLQLAPGIMLGKHDLSFRAIDALLIKAAKRYRTALVAPGEGVGALGASSIGEPSTQLTLNTFHSTGAGNITNAPEGLPRFKQLINAQDTAATAKMTIRFLAMRGEF